MDSINALSGRRWLQASVLVLVLAAGLFARTLRCSDGLPYLHRWGEPNIGSRSLDILRTGDLNPHWFHYGSPTLYLHAAVDAVHYVWLCSQPEDARHSIRSLDDIETKTDTKYQWTLSHPSFFLWNRLATALIGAGAVLLTFILARHVAGPWAATFATAIVAGAAAHIEVATTIRTDMPAALLALGCVLATLRAAGARPLKTLGSDPVLSGEGRPSTLVLAFILAGLAASTKYNVVIAVGVPCFALALATARRSPLARPWLWAVALLLPPVAFLIGSPYALLDLSTFLSHAGAEVSHYKIEGQGVRTVEPGWSHLVAQLGQFVENTSWVAMLMCALGAVLLLRHQVGWLLLAFPLAYLTFMTRTTVDFHHNFVTIYPFIAACAACGAEALYRRLRDQAPAAVAPLFALALAGMTAAHLIPQVSEALRINASQETRTQAASLARDLAKEHGWTRIGIASELRMHRVDLAELQVEYEVRTLRQLMAADPPFDAIVCPTEYTARKRQSGKPKDRVDEMNRINPKGEVLGSIEGKAIFLDIRSINPGVSILRLDRSR